MLCSVAQWGYTTREVIVGRFHRAQVLLDPEQYRRLRDLARTRSLQQGRRVSISQVIRELLDRALDETAAEEARARAALHALLALGDAVQARHPQPLPEDWLTQDREELDNVRFAHLFPGG